MKITYVSCYERNCGIGRYVEELAKEEYINNKDIILYRKGDPIEPFIKNYPYRSFKNLRVYIAPFYLAKAMSKIKSEIWHADYVDGGYAMWLAGKRNQHIVTTVHDAIPYIFNPPKKIDFLIYKNQLSVTDKISKALIVVSEKSKEDLINYTKINPEKIHVVYNGINHDFFYPDVIKQKNEIFTIRYSGGLGGRKNIPLLLNTAKILEERNIEFKMEISGIAGNQNGLDILSKELKLKNVSFVGYIPDEKLRSFLAEADLFLFPSLYEGFGFPPLEAMACGTATIAANTGSLPEIIKDGGILAEPTPENFAGEIVKLINDTKLKETIAERGLQVSREYTWKKAAFETKNIYNKILNS